MNRYLILISALCLFAICHSMAQVNQIDGNFIKDWLILGPFSGNNIDQDYLESVDGEANVNPEVGDTIKTVQGQTLTWNLYRSQEDIANLLQAVGNHTNVTAYAFCHLQGERDLDTKSYWEVMMALQHARRPKPGGGVYKRYFIDTSYCQAGILWGGYPNIEEINRIVLEKGCDRHGKYVFLYDTSQFFDRRSHIQRLEAVNKGSLALQL